MRNGLRALRLRKNGGLANATVGRIKGTLKVVTRFVNDLNPGQFRVTVGSHASRFI
jgi:hypothetical protein